MPEEENDDAFESRNETEEDSKNMIYVHVCGQVVNPGVYELCPGDRVTHAIHAAGGMTEDASSAFLNLAALLEDGQKIYVPTEAEAEQFLSQGTSGSDSMPGDWKQSTAGIGQNENTSEDAKVNLNTAGKAELMTLSGIGESRAEAIITYRQEHGRFESIEDIKNIEGIKDGIFNRIKDQLTV